MSATDQAVDTAAGPASNGADQQTQLLRHGMEQFRLLHSMLPADGLPSGGWEAVEDAATRAARFALVEGWAHGATWLAVGPKLLLFSWAFEQGLDPEDYRRSRATRAYDRAG